MRYGNDIDFRPRNVFRQVLSQPNPTQADSIGSGGQRAISHVTAGFRKQGVVVSVVAIVVIIIVVIIAVKVGIVVVVAVEIAIVVVIVVIVVVIVMSRERFPHPLVSLGLRKIMKRKVT